MANKQSAPSRLNWISVIRRLDLPATFASVGGLLIMAMVLMTSVDVLGRKFLALPLPGSHGITIMLFMASVFLGMAECQKRGQHVRVEFIADRLPPSVVYAIKKFGHFVVLIVFAAIAWQFVGMAQTAWRIGDYEWLGIRLYTFPVLVTLVVASILTVIQAALDLFRRK